MGGIILHYLGRPKIIIADLVRGRQESQNQRMRCGSKTRNWKGAGP